MSYKSVIFAAATLLAVMPATANPELACAFIPRAKAVDILSEVNKSVVGLAVCNEAVPDLTSLLVARFTTLDETVLKQFLRDVSLRSDGTAKSETITWQSSQPLASRQFLIRTGSPPNPSRDHLESMMHYAFVARAPDKSYLVFIHTTHEKAALRLKSSLPQINRLLSNARFTSSIH